MSEYIGFFSLFPIRKKVGIKLPKKQEWPMGGRIKFYPLYKIREL